MHPSTKSILQFFEYGHLNGELAAVSRPFCEMAHKCAEDLDGPELTAGLRKLLEAKDCMVRASVASGAVETDTDVLCRRVNEAKAIQPDEA